MQRHDRKTNLLHRLAAILVIVSVAGLSLTSTLGLHLHTLADGRIVVHSHPAQNGEKNGSGHQHSSGEYATLDVFGKLLQSADLNVTAVEVSVPLCSGWLEPFGSTARPHSGFISVYGRSPPSVTSV
ncbi:MAG: hypothetical protein GY867_06070 [bacterium]|nr:hypothetical protein [bacterium]